MDKQVNPVRDKKSKISGESRRDSISNGIKKVIKEDINPMVAGHGGNIEFVEEKDGVVKVRLEGACAGCAFSEMTLKNLVEETLKKKMPRQIKSVEAV